MYKTKKSFSRIPSLKTNNNILYETHIMVSHYCLCESTQKNLLCILCKNKNNKETKLKYVKYKKLLSRIGKEDKVEKKAGLIFEEMGKAIHVLMRRLVVCVNFLLETR